MYAKFLSTNCSNFLASNSDKKCALCSPNGKQEGFNFTHQCSFLQRTKSNRLKRPRPNKEIWLGINGETIAFDIIVSLRGRLLGLTQKLEQKVEFERAHFSLYNVLSRC